MIRPKESQTVKKSLVDPVKIPSGNTICRAHVDELLEEDLRRKIHSYANCAKKSM